MNAKTDTPMMLTIAFTHDSTSTKYSVYANSGMIIAVDQIFARKRITPPRCQSRISGPKVVCDNSQSWQRVEPFEKQNAAKRTNGVVGNSGKKTPSIASPIQAHPIIKNRTLDELKVRFTRISLNGRDGDF